MDQRSDLHPELTNSEFNVPILGNLPLVKQNMEAFSSTVNPAVPAEKPLPLTRFM